MSRTRLVTALLALALPALARAQLQVISTAPTLNATASVGTTVAVTFDRALDTATVDVDSFRVFGQRSGAARGTFAFSNGNATVTLTPDAPFSAGEFVVVTLSHDLRGADTSPLRAAGYSWQFMTATAPSAGTFLEIDRFSNRSGSGNTRIYGAAGTDFNGDGWVDLATVNEDSADVRVFLNQADGSGLFGPMLAPEPIGVESSPNCSADFDNDGNADICVGAANDDTVWVLLGAGDGTFPPGQEIPVGNEAHGIVNLDVDGDGDDDIVNANVGSDDLSLMLNDGNGTFGAPTFFDAGVAGEYGLVSADMNGDGIQDLVVAGRNGGEVRTLLGNGDGTFTPAGPAQSCGGLVWVVVLGDVNGDGELDAVTANDGSGTIGVLLGNGDGTFAPVSLVTVGPHVPSVDLGDLDGDGDLDMVVSSFGGGFWRRYENDGTGSFSQVEDITAESNPSCSILADIDNDGDLDMALTDEIADVVILMQNTGSSTPSPCSPAPAACRQPLFAGKSKLTLKNKSPDTADSLVWQWAAGPVTTKAELGNPVTTDSYALCLYEDGALVQGWDMPAGGLCNGKPCWKDVGKGFGYSDKLRTPDGIQTAKLLEGVVAAKAKMKVKGKGPLLLMPDLTQLGGVLDVQLQNSSGGVCFGATYSPPFQKADGLQLKDVSDAAVTTTTTSTSTTTTLPALWSAIHAQVIVPSCGSCHGGPSGSGGLNNLGDCNAALAALVNVPSTELAAMDRVEPGDPSNSWMMHKLDGTQGSFSAQCGGGFCGSQMPLVGGPLSQPVRDAIRAWITNGAVNDCP